MGFAAEASTQKALTSERRIHVKTGAKRLESRIVRWPLEDLWMDPETDIE